MHCHRAGTLVQFEEDLFIIVLFSISARLLGVKDIFQDVRPTQRKVEFHNVIKNLEISI